jgi:hypothetical protein
MKLVVMISQSYPNKVFTLIENLGDDEKQLVVTTERSLSVYDLTSEVKYVLLISHFSNK